LAFAAALIAEVMPESEHSLSGVSSKYLWAASSEASAISCCTSEIQV
jgi:hypothetical protein